MEIDTLREVLGNRMKQAMVMVYELTDDHLRSVAECLREDGFAFEAYQYTSNGWVVLETLSLDNGATISAEPFHELNYNGPITVNDAVMVVCNHAMGES